MAIADDFDGFLIDLDGVVYVGDRLVPGSDAGIHELRARGKRVLFLTNDPRSSREEYSAKLRGLGVEVEASNILTSGAATARYVAGHEETSGRSAFVIGSAALKSEVRGAGLVVTEAEDGRDADVASHALRHGAAFYAAGRDATFPMPDGPWPATGAILAAVEKAAGRTAHVIGKPEPEMFRVAVEMLKGTGRIVVVGDRLDSDVAGGHRAGLATVLVLTGSATEAEAVTADPAPDFVVPDLKALVLDR